MRKGKLFFLIFTGVCLCISAYLGFYFAEQAQSIFSEDYLEAVAAEAKTDPIRLNGNARVTITYRYLFCSHEETVNTNAQACGYAGKSQAELEAEAGLTVRAFSQNHARLILEEAEYCTKHYIVKRNGDAVYVYKTNRKTGVSEIYLDVHLKMQEIKTSEQERLKTGVVFERTSDINRYLNEIQK